MNAGKNHKGGHPAPKLEATYGRWTVIEVLPGDPTKPARLRRRRARVRCTCGNEKVVPIQTLRSGESQSCGCLRSENLSKAMHQQNWGKQFALKHGEATGQKTYEYRTWVNLRNYHKDKYGDRWPTYPDFLAEVGRRPTPVYHLNVITLRWEVRSTGMPLRRRPAWVTPPEVSARIDEQLAAEDAAAQAWLEAHGAEVPPLLPYMLDRPAFVCYDESAYGGPRLSHPVISQLNPKDEIGCRRVGHGPFRWHEES